MMSRPLPSAPRKNLPSALRYCGPIGTPSSPTTFFFSPSTVIVSVRCPLLGPVFATWSAQSGAAAHRATSNTKMSPNSSATLLRRSLRRPSFHGPRPCTRSRSASSSQAAGPWRVVSVAGSVAIESPQLPRRKTLPHGEGAEAPSPRIAINVLLEAEARVVVEVHRVEAGAVLEVHPLRDERRQLPVAVGDDPCPLDQLVVEVLPVVLSLGQLRLLVQVRDPLRDLRVVNVPEVLVVRRLDRLAVYEEHEVLRVREVLEPVGEAGLGLRLLVADRLEVDTAVEDLGLGVEAHLAEHVRVRLGHLVGRVVVVAVDGHVHAVHAGFLDQSTGLLEVRRVVRVAPRAVVHVERLVEAGHARRQERA